MLAFGVCASGSDVELGEAGLQLAGARLDGGQRLQLVVQDAHRLGQRRVRRSQRRRRTCPPASMPSESHYRCLRCLQLRMTTRLTAPSNGRPACYVKARHTARHTACEAVSDTTQACRQPSNHTFVDVRDEVAQLVAAGGQGGGDAVGALVQRIPLRRVVVQQRPLLLPIQKLECHPTAR